MKIYWLRATTPYAKLTIWIPRFYKKKQKAADYFTKKLLESEAGKNIERIILFGSVAKGEADEYSDIDILLFTCMPEKVRNVLWEVCMDAYEKHEESIEPLVYPLKKYTRPDSYFLYQSIQTGKQLYPKRIYVKNSRPEK